MCRPPPKLPKRGEEMENFTIYLDKEKAPLCKGSWLRASAD